MQSQRVPRQASFVLLDAAKYQLCYKYHSDSSATSDLHSGTAKKTVLAGEAHCYISLLRMKCMTREGSPKI